MEKELKYNDYDMERSYDKGVEYGKQQTKSDWVSVDDGLPDGLIFNCLVCLDNEGVFEAYYSDVTKEFESIAFGKFKDVNKVTHWQPLPQPPKTK